MLGPRWFVMAKLWARNPPSAAKVRFVFGIIAFCFLLFAVERFFGWPAWLTPVSVSSPR